MVSSCPPCHSTKLEIEHVYRKIYWAYAIKDGYCTAREQFIMASSAWTSADLVFNVQPKPRRTSISISNITGRGHHIKNLIRLSFRHSSSLRWWDRRWSSWKFQWPDNTFWHVVRCYWRRNGLDRWLQCNASFDPGRILMPNAHESIVFRCSGDTIKQKASLIYRLAVVKKGGRRERMQRCCDERRRWWVDEELPKLHVHFFRWLSPQRSTLIQAWLLPA